MADKHPWGSDWKTIQLPASFDSAYRVMINDTPYVVTTDELGYAEVPFPVYERLQEMIDAKERYPVAKSGGKIAKLHVVTDEGEASAISLQNLKDGVSTASNMSHAATCDNMTYEEAVEVIQSGEPLGIYITAQQSNILFTDYSASHICGNGVIMIVYSGAMQELARTWYWTADGISTVKPG